MDAAREIHPAADLLRMMSQDEFQRLMASIKAYGLRDPIEVDKDGKIIDGRNREKACKELGIEPEYKLADTTGLSLLEYSVIKNVDRRHLGASERAMLAADIRNYMRTTGDTTSFIVFSNGRKQTVSESENTWEGQEPPPGEPSVSDLADALDVSETYIRHAGSVKLNGCEELEAAVRAGDIKIREACKLATFPTVIQKRAIAEGPSAIRDLIKAPVENNETTESRMADWNMDCERWARRCTGSLMALPENPLVDPGIRSTIESHLAAAAGSMRTAKAYALCPRCEGGGCTFCAELGFVNRVTYESNHHDAS